MLLLGCNQFQEWLSKTYERRKTFEELLNGLFKAFGLILRSAHDTGEKSYFFTKTI